MKKTLNIEFDPAMMMLVGAHLKAAELGRLFRALAAHMAGEDAGQHLTNSALRLAFALLGPAIDESLERLATNRANGAKGGRPRKQPLPVQVAASAVTEAEPTKKSKKEDLPPAPPIEEKNKKIILLLLLLNRARARNWNKRSSTMTSRWSRLACRSASRPTSTGRWRGQCSTSGTLPRRVTAVTSIC